MSFDNWQGTRVLTPLIMPKLGESVTVGVVERWLKQPGDIIEVDEPIVEISTDKVTAEVPSPLYGRLVQILVQVGEVVPVETPIATLESLARPNGSAISESAKQVDEQVAQQVGASSVAAPDAPEANAQVQHAVQSSVDRELRTLHREEVARLRSTPLVRKLAAEAGVSLSDIQGTGFGNRVRREDLEAFLSTRGNQTVPEVVAQAPYTALRRILGERLVASRRNIPDASTFFEIDMTVVARRRRAEQQTFFERHGVHLTYLPFAIAAVAQALKAVPGANVRVAEGGLVPRTHANIGVTVGLDGNGQVGADALLLPVIQSAETLSLAEIARSVLDLATRARSGHLKPEELSGATYTVNNTGAFGSVLSTPIIPDGQTAIVTTEAVVKRPIVLTDAEGNDSIAIRSMMFMCLTFDHRAYDGMTAGRFLNSVKRWLEHDAAVCTLE